MRIGVDARALTVPTFGIGRYTRCLLEELVKLPGVAWYIYADRPILAPPMPSNVVVREYKRKNRALSIYRTQVQFKKWAISDKVDLFWSPRHHLPLGLPDNIAKVVTIHDMVWAKYPETMIFANRLIETWLMPKKYQRG